MENINVRSTEVENVCPATVLQRIPVIINKILETLPMKSLHACARVCRTWNEIVKKIKQTRTSLHWLCVQGEDEENQKDHNIVEDLTMSFQLTSEPAHVFVFCTSSLFEESLYVPSKSQSRRPRLCKSQSYDVESFITSLLPSSCKCYSVAADGIIGSSVNKTVEIEHSVMAMTYLAIPRLPGVEIYDFFIDLNKHIPPMTPEIPDLFNVEEVTTVPYDQEVKAILFFSDLHFCPQEIQLGLLDYYNGCPVVGGYVDHIVTPLSECGLDESSDSQVRCIALCGPNVQVASVVVKEDTDSEKEIEKELLKLKACNLPTEKSFAFMFACLGRGKSYHHGKENVESSIFRKIFPQTPLFGFFGNGEIGMNYLHPYDSMENGFKSKKTKTSRHHPKLSHAYTSIFLLVSITSC
ncbi:F-box only protein 22-like isoform X2 [Saccostrea echinata]|uniref:F-box only protein 22-like isoform X2 n=1 Tax=Saccostrea echinata TaxID=191078 RepID=UPI002A81EEE5|nr:F-box only protein 22-like isoform X2 [Saccostrea echinata]